MSLTWSQTPKTDFLVTRLVLYLMPSAVFSSFPFKTYEPPHDTTNKSDCAPSEDSDQPGRPLRLIRIFAVRLMVS